MKYPESHWDEVAKCYLEARVYEEELTGGKTESTVRTEKVQNHYPYTTLRTVQGWIKKCYDKGLL